jgi:hypothetical protein
VPEKTAENLEWRDREDLRDLIVCSIDPPGKPFFLRCKLTLQAVRISTTRCMLVCSPMATLKLVSVSDENLCSLTIADLQTLPTSPTLSTPTTQWTRRLLRVEPLCTLLTSVLICFLSFWVPTFARSVRSSSVWPSPSFG